MRKFVVASCVFLALSGGFLHFQESFEGGALAGILATLHIWVGIFFVVIFPMYAWDHIRKNRKRLKRISWVSVSGAIQVFAGAGLIFSGVILLLYGTHRLAFSTEAHYQLTYLFSISLLLHFFIKK